MKASADGYRIYMDLKLLPLLDGDPDSWFTPHSEDHRRSYVTNKYVYPNTQPATAFGFTIMLLGKRV